MGNPVSKVFVYDHSASQLSREKYDTVNQIYIKKPRCAVNPVEYPIERLWKPCAGEWGPCLKPQVFD
jgi:hypothetical protein